MNFLGHNYIAYKVIGEINSNTVVGSHIPDFVPFLASSVFTFEEIHEDHEGFLAFVSDKYPDALDLPLSMMCHSVKYGADEYNRKIPEWLIADDEYLANEIANMIVDASGITFEMARIHRLHNYLWGGVDVYLMKTNHNDLVGQIIGSFNQVDYDLTAKILADHYKKDKNDVKANILAHFVHFNPEKFKDLDAYVRAWGFSLSGLPEKDQLDPTKGREILDFIYNEFINRWGEITGNVVQLVREKMEPFLDTQ